MLSVRLFNPSLPVAASLIAALAAACAAAEEPVPIGSIISAEPLMPGIECEADAAEQCAFVASDAARCSMPLDTGCLLHDGDVLTLNGVALTYRICEGPVRRIAFTNGPVRYELSGTCPDTVSETLSVLFMDDLGPELGEQED